MWTVLGLLAISYFGNEDGVMDKIGKTGGRCSAEENAAAIRVVRIMRAELGTDLGTAQRVEFHPVYGVESVRSWVRQPGIDGGVKPSVASDAVAEVQRHEHEPREMKRPNEILKRAVCFCRVELDRQHR